MILFLTPDSPTDQRLVSALEMTRADDCSLFAPSGMVLVRTETGQLVMVPQQVLAQAQAKTQQGQTVANISQRPGTPTAGAAIRVSTATTVGCTPHSGV